MLRLSASTDIRWFLEEQISRLKSCLVSFPVTTGWAAIGKYQPDVL